MKTKLTFFLLIIAILMTSCQTRLPVSSDSPTQQGGESPVATPYIDDKSSALNIKKVSHLFDREFTLGHGAETTYGYYEYMQRWVDGFSTDDYTHSGNLVFTDYRTEQMIYLCDVPGCAHNNANCTSYIEYSKGMILVPDYEEKHIIIVSMGTNYRDITSDFQLASISIMDNDGSNRRELLRLKAAEMISDEDELYADDQNHLYYVVVVGEMKKELRRLDLITGEEEVLLSTEIAVVSRHSFGDYILLDYYGKTPSQVKLFSVSNRQLIDKKTVSKGYLSVVPFSHCYMAYYNEDIYNPNTIKVDLSIFDYETDEIVKVIKDLPCAPEFYCDQHVFDSNSKIEWLYMDKNENRNAYIVDLETGECSECLRYYDSHRERTRPVSILAETGDGRLLVIIGSKKATVTQIDPQGVPHLFDLGYCREAALISIEDYCAGIPNYHIIDCKTIDWAS